MPAAPADPPRDHHRAASSGARSARPAARAHVPRTAHRECRGAGHLLRRARTVPEEVLPWWAHSYVLPIALKGICHPDDARRAIDDGIDAIYCSNHGGRQANAGLAAIDLLPDVVAAAGDVPVIFDSGVRSGTDVAKALAVGGTAGVVHQLETILAELDLLMAIDGYPTIADLRKAGVRRA